MNNNLNINNIVANVNELIIMLNNNIDILTKIDTKKYKSITIEEIINLIKKNVVEYKNFYGLLEFFELSNKNNNILKAKLYLDDYTEKLLSNKKYYNLLNIICSKNITNEQKLFIKNQIFQYKINCLNCNNNEKLIKITETINKLKLCIKADLINKYFYFNINEQKLKININNYNHTIKNINLHTDRINLQQNYHQMSNDILNNFVKLLILKHEFAKKNGFNNYGHYLLNKSQKEFNLIESQIKNILNYMSNNIKKIFYHIRSDLNLEKICESDIIYWFHQKKNNIKFSVNDIIELFFTFIENKFNLNRKSPKDYSVENKKKINIYNKNQEIGSIYFDLLNNKLHKPQITVLSEYNKFYTNNKQTIVLPSIVISAGYQNLTDKKLSINDSVYLFKQLGYILHHLVHRSEYGLNNVEINMHNVIPLFMEHSFYNIININDDLKKILKMERISKLFFSCINSIFDVLIYTSEYFVDSCVELVKDENNLGNIMNNLYFQIYDHLIESYNDVFFCPEKNINFNILIDNINGNSCISYSNVLNNIISFNLSKLIIDENKGNEFIDILSNPNDNFSFLLKEFFKTNNIDMMDIDNFLENNSINTIIKKEKIKKSFLQM